MRGAAAVQDGTVQGFIDEVTPDGFLWGWCAPGAAPFRPRRVDVLVDGVCMAAGLLCDVPRPDLVEAGIGDGAHGFELELPTASMRPGVASVVALRDSEAGQGVGEPVRVVWAGQMLAAAQMPGVMRVVFLCGGGKVPGRVARLVSACGLLGHRADAVTAPALATGADVLVLWHVALEPASSAAILSVRQAGGIVVAEGGEALGAADAGLAISEAAARAGRFLGRPVHILPDGFDAAMLMEARLSARLQAARPPGRAGCAGTAEGLGLAAAAVAPGADVAVCDVWLEPGEGDPMGFVAAALAGVPVVAAAGGALAGIIRDGETGLLAEAGAWSGCVSRLLADAPLRRSLAQAAHHDVLWHFGPERRAQALQAILEQFRPGEAAARAFELEWRRKSAPRPALPQIPAHDIVFAADRGAVAAATVIVPVHDYEGLVAEALDSVADQDEAVLDLVVIDDASNDRSLPVVLEWARRRVGRFNRLLVLRNRENAGLGPTRNVGFAASETGWVLPLDADNRLRPECVRLCLAAVTGERLAAVTGERLAAVTSGRPAAITSRRPAAVPGGRAAFAYPRIAKFGMETGELGGGTFAPTRLAGGNTIGAMALVSKAAWAAVGGYAEMRLGWEDYDFWCRMAEQGFWGTPVAEVLAEYRVHPASMLRRVTQVGDNMPAVMAQMRARHPWVDVAGVNEV